jgi:ATP-binding cassette subfamily B protein
MEKEIKISVFKILTRIFSYISLKHRVWLSFLLMLMLAVSILEIISIGLVIPFLGVLTSPESIFYAKFSQPFIDFFKFREPNEIIKPLAILFATGAIFSAGGRLLLHWTQARICQIIGSDFSIGIYRKIIYQPYETHLSRNSSEIISGVINKADALVYQCLLPVLVITSSAIMLITVLASLIFLDPIMTSLAFVTFGGIYTLVIIITKNKLAEESSIINREHSRVIKSVQEALGGIRDVIIDGTQEFYCQIYEKSDRRLRRAQSNVSLISISPRYLVEALCIAAIAGLSYALASRLGGLSDAIPLMGAIAFGAQRMLPVLQNAYSNWSVVRGGQSSLNEALNLIELPLPYISKNKAGKLLNYNKELTLINIGFRYASRQEYVIKNLNLKIKKGSCVGIIGTTGSGKSTLLDILMGLLKPTEGIISVDGIKITSDNYRNWQMHIAHVPQSIFLADASIAQNIALGVPINEIDYQNLYRSAKLAQISESIDSWDKKYETIVGERGVRLSGGQRQRIGIARALYKRVDVIVLDEATSALDTETEQKVMKSILDLRTDITILMVAHRLTTLRNCDSIIEIHNGSINRIGTYEEIVEGNEKKKFKLYD